jgi:hypothetical protein
MSQSNVNIGSGPSVGDGDPLRVSFDKINQNFTELYAIAGSVSTLSNVVVADVGNVIATSYGNVDLGNVTSMTTYANISSIDYHVISSPVNSVAGKVGNVVLTIEDVPGAASIRMVTNSLAASNAINFVVANVGNVIATSYGNIDLGNVTSLITNATINGLNYDIISPVNSVANKVGDVVLFVADIYDSALKLNIRTAVPSTSKGSSGDMTGMVASDATYFYYCTQYYDGITDIWHKIANDGTTW